ncbi:NADP-dependent oxidoreductase [Chryseobacterium viscerum]|uniref:NADPH:quinone oxidoreductase n=1 Tax=Chryseobacterium viscerum TaxID=1037377 RepID=A0A316WAW4_9FLAO|nr:NADP-dependent oxidoreductase [Chryseobacterium viscerum]PWN58377.1 NADPH:quinone oxidoreductase [Chryseobacterium viscerum]
MKAYTINRYSKTEPLKLSEIAKPVVKPNEVLIEIHSASINQLDAKIKSGEFKMMLKYKMPLILGHDVAGVVTQVGSNVKRFKVGDEVYSRPVDYHIGGFAEFISVDERYVALKPSNISMDEAASLPLVALTVWQAFVEKAHLKKGQKVFIQAGSGGVGTIAIQLAKHLGATVATTTSKGNFDLVKNLGADVAIDYKTQDFENELKDYDLVLNSQDTKTLEKSLRILKRGGKAVSISGPPEPDFAKEMGLSWFLKLVFGLISKKVRKQAERLGVSYSFLFMKANGDQLTKITKLVESGAVKPVLDKVYSFNEMNDAMDYVNSGRAKGKVVVRIK